MSESLPDIPDDIVEAYFESDKYAIPPFSAPVQQLDQSQLNLLDTSISYNQNRLQSQASNGSLHHNISQHKTRNDPIHYGTGPAFQNSHLLPVGSLDSIVSNLADFGYVMDNRVAPANPQPLPNATLDDAFGFYPLENPLTFNIANADFTPLSNGDSGTSPPVEVGVPIQFPFSSSTAAFNPSISGNFIPNSASNLEDRSAQLQFLAALDNSIASYDYRANLDHNMQYDEHEINQPTGLNIPAIPPLSYSERNLRTIKDELASILEQSDLTSKAEALTGLCKEDSLVQLVEPPLPWEESGLGPYKPLVLKQGVNLVMEMRRVLKAPEKFSESPFLVPIRNTELTPSPSGSSTPSPSSSNSSTFSLQQKKHLFRSQLSTSSSRILDRNVSEFQTQHSPNAVKTLVCKPDIYGAELTSSMRTSLNDRKFGLGASSRNYVSGSSGNSSESSTASSNGSPVTMPIGTMPSGQSQVNGRQLIEQAISLVQEAISPNDGHEHQTWVDDWIYRGDSPVNKSGIESQHEAIKINPRLDYQIREIIQQWTPYKPRTDRFFRITDKNCSSFNTEELKEMLEIVTSRPPRRINYYPAYQLCTDGEIGQGQTVTDWRHMSALHPPSSKTRQPMLNHPPIEPGMEESERPVPNLRKREGNIYEPTWVRGKKKLKEGWCDHCEGGFYLMKNSGYLYHKNHEHGIFPNGYIFEDPLVIRRKMERESKWEGLCGICYHWIDLDHTERKCWGTWYRHYKQCANEYEEFKKVLAATGAPVHLVELRYCPIDETLENS
ncbi:Meiotic expression up-regulated protein-like protein [Sugiyamaella lignohabitans]|uniref:Meiotic expression up-regulated protein-like protein n=1 Tax=Sugiyamaella lignohabitans TaxID=796027 RepID=A0A167EI71_9ASCO|nr:Meiotic expression up-regulated protein-like protein [Sugiyamaella lignohabitans]ANB14114.1 Meiotic expression up-regulated protein-like protein [Sugiyamaella lignohabitans]